MIVVRDSAEAIRVVEQTIALHDMPEPEVMLEVEILEVKRSRLLEQRFRTGNTRSMVLGTMRYPVERQRGESKARRRQPNARCSTPITALGCPLSAPISAAVDCSRSRMWRKSADLRQP